MTPRSAGWLSFAAPAVRAQGGKVLDALQAFKHDDVSDEVPTVLSERDAA